MLLPSRKSPMPRADLLLVAQGLAPSRTAAQNLIAAGRVHWDEFDQWRAVTKASQSLPDGVQLRVTPDPADRYVSRGGLKRWAVTSSGLSRGMRYLGTYPRVVWAVLPSMFARVKMPWC